MRITLCPNINSVQIPPPILVETIDEWQLYSHSVDPTAAFELCSSNLLFLIETKVILPNKCDGISACKHVIHLIQGHRPDIITIDQPLAFGLSPSPPYGFPWPADHCDLSIEDVSSIVRIFIDLCHTHSVPTVLVETWPQHTVEEIINFIGNLQVHSSGVFRFIFNWDPNAGASQIELSETINKLRNFCKDLSIEFGTLITCHPSQPGGIVYSSDEFISSALGQWRRLRQCGNYDRVVIQSRSRGPNGSQDIPPTSALITLAEEIQS